MDGGELVGAAEAAELVEHSASAHGLELAGVADEREPPSLRPGEGDEAARARVPSHAGLVDDHGGARPGVGTGRVRGRSVRFHSWSSLAERCRCDAGLVV